MDTLAVVSVDTLLMIKGIGLWGPECVQHQLHYKDTLLPYMRAVEVYVTIFCHRKLTQKFCANSIVTGATILQKLGLAFQEDYFALIPRELSCSGQ